MFEEIFRRKKYYKVKYPNTAQLGLELIPRIEQYIERKGKDYFSFWKVKNGGLTCYPHDLINEQWADILSHLNDFIVEHTKIYCNEVGYNKGKIPYVKNQWFTYYPTNGYFDYHRHNGVLVTAVLYVKKEHNGGNLQLRDNLRNGIIEEIEIPVDQGDLLIFPGYLDHKSQPNLSNFLRSTISTDMDFIRS